MQTLENFKINFQFCFVLLCSDHSLISNFWFCFWNLKLCLEACTSSENIHIFAINFQVSFESWLQIIRILNLRRFANWMTSFWVRRAFKFLLTMICKNGTIGLSRIYCIIRRIISFWLELCFCWLGEFKKIYWEFFD